MSLLAATQIPKPSDEQAFERASIVLWRGLLNDPNVQRNGRRGQRQNGVDLFGVRNGDPSHHVGIQCKLKGPDQILTEDEVRDEVKKALTFRPELREYFIITTAPDDVALQELARELAADLRKKGQTLLIYIWGWNTVEERISEDAAARKQFDPDYGAFSEQILDQVTRVAVGQEEIKAGIDIGLSQIDARLARFETLQTQPGDATTTTNVLEAQFDADIDTFRDLANAGRPKTALPLLEGLLARIKDTASGRILFRVKANIGSCLLALGEDARAAELLSEAYDHAPSEPKAITNKAFSLLLQGRWQELLSFGADALRGDPKNEGLAGYFVQAARFDTSIADPLDLLPDAVRNSAAVTIARVDFLRHRGIIPAWWQAARDALAAYPRDPHATQFAAEADLDEILRSEEFQRTRLFEPGDRTRIQAVVEILAARWNKARSSEGVLRPEHAALCANLIVALHALDDNPRAIEVARQGLESLPDDTEIASRAVAVAIDGHDEDLARRNLPKLPPSPEATVLAFRFHAQRHDWAAVAELYKSQAAHIPDVERPLIDTAGRLAEIKIAAGNDTEVRIRALAAEVREDARASVVVADFATMEGLETVAQEAYEAALKGVDADTHIASRLMVAMQAAKRSDWNTLVDLLDGHVAEDHDSIELRALARAFVNNTPIQKRAIRFFERIPPSIRSLPFYVHAAGLLHFNRGALKQAEETLRRAIAVEPDITNYLTLFATLRRSERRDEIGPILEMLDAAGLDGTPGQKMYLAQEMFAAGQPEKAVRFAYEVMQSARNDPEAALRYFGLLMLDQSGGLIPTLDAVGVDAWVRLQGPHGESHSFLVAEGADRPAEGVLSPTHPIAAAAQGLRVGETFTLKNGIGDDFEWRVAEIKHKYLHALHNIMENFQTHFPDAKGLYRISIRDGDIQPALAQVRKLSENNRRLADLYLVQHVPMAMVASQFGGDPIGFVEYIRSLDRNIETCVGAEPERVAARETIARHRANGAVLDTYTAWTAATMDVLGVLAAVFGKLVVPQSVVDELRNLRDKDAIPEGPSMTLAWQNGQYFRQEHTQADADARRSFIGEQILKIEQACEVIPGSAPDSPSKVASLMTETFGSHVLDSANIAKDGYVLVSEDMYFRQVAEAAVGGEGVWLQSVLTFARDMGIITHEQLADSSVKLAWRRHSHVSADPVLLFDALNADHTERLDNFRALAQFIGAKSADMKSHLSVAALFLAHIWNSYTLPNGKVASATGILLECLIRYRPDDWAWALSFVTSDASGNLRAYVENWVLGHFLSKRDLSKAELELSAIRAELHARAVQRRSPSILCSTSWPLRR